jgi:hypothetical protein
MATALSRLPSRNPREFELMAKLIAGDAAPAWLAESLGRWVGSIFVDRHIHQRQPTRAEMRQVLEQILNGDLTADDFPPSDPVVEFLAAFGDASTEACCRRALQSLQTGKSETRRGPGKAIPPKGIAPKDLLRIDRFRGVGKGSRKQAAAEVRSGGKVGGIALARGGRRGPLWRGRTCGTVALPFHACRSGRAEGAAQGVQEASIISRTFFEATHGSSGGGRLTS